MKEISDYNKTLYKPELFVINQGNFHQMEIVSAPLAASADGKHLGKVLFMHEYI